ncbi:MAG: Ig-like domain-containing protein [Bacillota bacterium]|nr:Ig-like domain-containing protein [Bacillota bacterium]
MKRFVSLLLVISLILTAFGVPAFAAKPVKLAVINVMEVYDYDADAGGEQEVAVFSVRNNEENPTAEIESGFIAEVTKNRNKFNLSIEKKDTSFVTSVDVTLSAFNSAEVETTETITIGVISNQTVNNPPVADDKEVTTNEDASASITLTGSDPDSDEITFSVLDGPAHGLLSGTAPDLIYTPKTDYNGSDSFTYVVNDGQVDSLPATVSITVTAVNDDPVAIDLSLTTDQDTSVSGTIDATDVDDDTLGMTISSGPSNGNVTNSVLDFTYTPTSEFTGEDSFTVTVTDGFGGTDDATVTVTVDPVVSEPTKYVALGDSIPYGYYNSSFWDYLGGGTDTYSYVERFADDLDAEFTDASVSGYNTIDVLNQIDSMTATIAEADVITLCVGANDIMDAAGRGFSGLQKYNINWTAADQGRDNFELYWPQLIDKIENLNSDVTLIVMTIYNPYHSYDDYWNLVDPYFSASIGEDLGLNYMIENAMDLDETKWDYVDINDDFDYRIADVYTVFNNHGDKDSLTGFYDSFCDPHPNQIGQDVIYQTHWNTYN